MDPERKQPPVESTGDSRVDEAIAGLAALDELPLDDRPAALEAVHDRLREILGELGAADRLGHPGHPGRPGEQGALGEQGEQGEQGAPGEPGEQGAVGEQGAPGEPGETGRQ